MPELGKVSIAPISGPLDGKVLAVNHRFDRGDDRAEEVLKKHALDSLTARLGNCKDCPNAMVGVRRAYYAHDQDEVLEGRAKCKTGTCSYYRHEGLVLTPTDEGREFRERVMRGMSMKAAAISDVSSIPGAASILNDNRVSDHVVDAMKYAMTSLIDSSKDRPSSAAAGSW